MNQTDIAIIGGGILGHMLAYHMVRFRKIRSAILISSADYHRASTQNQSWLQSGALYNLDQAQSKLVAELCAMHGRKLLESRNISMANNFGVMALPNEYEAQKKIEFLNKYGFPYPEPLIPRRKVPHLIGNYLFNSGHLNKDTCFIRTPDQSFDEEGLLNFCKATIRRARFDFNWIEANAEILVNPLTRNGYSIKVKEEEYDPGILFVAAGFNTKRLLSPLQIAKLLDLRARRCVLMKAPLDLNLNASVFMDRVADININVIKGRKNEKLSLIGDSLYTTVPDLNADPFLKRVTEEDKNRLFKNLCQQETFPQLENIMKPLLSKDENFSVCYKVENDGVLPWIYETNEIAPKFPNIYIAGPGKATLAYYTANDLLDRAKIKLSSEPAALSALELENEIKMWYNKTEIK